MGLSDLLNGFGRNEKTSDVLKHVGFDESFDNILSSLTSRYGNTLKGALLKMLEVTVSLKDDESKKLQCEAIKETFNLTDEELNDYLLIVKIKKMYQTLEEDLEMILEMISDDESLYNDLSEEINEIVARKNMISALIDKYFGKIEEKPNKYSFSHNPSNVEPTYPVELSTNCNFLLYLSNVDELRENTVSSKSGKGQGAISSVYKELSLLGQRSYDDLLRNSLVHHILVQRYVGCKLTNDDLNFVRIGNGSTKIGYVKIPVLQENLDVLKKRYNNKNLDFLIMVVEFGDFKNEGISEEKMYLRFISDGYKMSSEMEDIIKIFKEPFTEENLEKACSMIESGADITRHLKESPMTPIKEGSSFRR